MHCFSRCTEYMQIRKATPALRELMSQEGRQKNRLLGGDSGRAVVVRGVKAEMGT